MKTTKDNNKQIRTRNNRGEYYVTPESKPERDEAGPYWVVDGITLWGKRVRLVRREYEAARLLRTEYEAADRKFKENNKKEIPTVIVSKVLDEARLAEAVRAVALLPKLKDSHLPDPNAHLDEGIQFALKCGWDPLAGSVTVAQLSVLLTQDLRRRAALEWEEKGHLSKHGLLGALQKQKWAVAIFGAQVLSEINSTEAQRKIIEASPETSDHKLAATLGLSQILHFLVQTERLGVARVFKYLSKKTSRPEAMSISEQQAYLDEFWPTVFAACAVARLFMGIRPWSETKKSKVKKDPIFGLSPDYRTFHVPHDGKTGWRQVVVPPVARFLFEKLDAEGRLSKEKDSHGNHVIHAGQKSAWTYHYARLGYDCLNGHSGRYENVTGWSREYRKKIFRNRYPVIHNKHFVADYPRKTNISAYLNVSDGDITRAAFYHGNSGGVINVHYKALMTRPEAVLHYRLIPTELRKETDINTIALPEFMRIKLDEDEQAEYNNLVANLTNGRPKGIRAHHPKQIAIILNSPEILQDALMKNPNKLRHIKLVNKTQRDQSLRRVHKQLLELAKFCKEHPEGFRLMDIRDIVATAGLPCPGGDHGPRWIFTFANEKGMYYFKANGEGRDCRYTLVNEIPKLDAHGNILKSVSKTAPVSE